MALLVLASCAITGSTASGSDVQLPWRLAADFERALDQPVRISWAGVPLREATRALARSQHVALLVDRRVDPQTPLDLRVEDRPLRDVLARIAENLQLGVAYVGGVIYLGPAETAARLPTVAALRKDEAAELTRRARQIWLAKHALQWNDFATPRELIEQITAAMDCSVSGLHQVPHDLWAAASLPPLARADQITLIAAQYELTYQIRDHGRKLVFVDLPQRVIIERVYAGGRNPQQLAERFRNLAPRANVRLAGPNVIVAAALEDHLRLTAGGNARRLSTARPLGGGRQLHTLVVSEAPLRRLLEQLAQRFSLDITFDEEAIRLAGLSLDEDVSVDVQNATTDELLEAVLEPVGLRLRRDKNRMIVVPVSP